MRMDWMNGIGECDMLLYITFFVGSMCRSVLACGFLGTYSSCALPWKSILSFPSCGFDLIFPSFTWRTLYKPSHHYHRIATSLYIALSPTPSTHNTQPQHPINTVRPLSSRRLVYRSAMLTPIFIQMFSSPMSFKSSVRLAFLSARPVRARSHGCSLFCSSRAQRSSIRPRYTTAA
jgi:hypothetical protein